MRVIFHLSFFASVGMIWLFSACRSTSDTLSTDPNLLPTGREIVERSRAVQGCQTMKVETRARVTDEKGNEREFLIVAYRKCVDGTQYTLWRVISSEGEPARVLLCIERPEGSVETVTYLPGFQKFVEIHDLGREDAIFGLSLQESVGGDDLYLYRTLGVERLDQQDVYKVEGRLRKGANSRFARVVTYYQRETFLPLRQELYNIRDDLVRIRRYVRWAPVDGHWTAMRTEIDNVRHRKHIVFETMTVESNVDWPLSFFDREHLRNLTIGAQ